VVRASGPPNQWKFSGASFAFVRLGDHPYTTRHGALAANLSAGVATPVVGFFKLFHGFRQRGALKRVLDARDPAAPLPQLGSADCASPSPEPLPSR
jgi:hypothetical protein